MYFRILVLSAFAIAIIAGLVLSVYQANFITPIIVGSEVYEIAEPVSHHTQVEETEAWAPEDGVERTSWNFASNFLLCFAYALILLGAMSLKASVNAVKGIFWGGAAYLTIFVAPALGLPPEIPGMEAAQLEGRQAWWLLTVVLTAISLWLIAFQNNLYRIIGVIILITPHILGAPQPEIHGFANTDPQAVQALTLLWHDFILQTSVANALLWVIIGVLSGYITKKFVYSIDVKGGKHV
jgi:cobalt transporter subunit CbtA